MLAENGEPLYRIDTSPQQVPAPIKFLQQVGEYVPGPSDLVDLWGGINQILLFANDHQEDGEPREGAAPWLTYFQNAAHEAHVARQVHQALTLLSDPRHPWRDILFVADEYHTWIRDPSAPTLTIHGVLVRRKVGPFNIRREFVAPDRSASDDVISGGSMAVFDKAS